MGGEAVGAHVGPVDQPALHHVPAEQPLEPAEHTDEQHLERERAVEGAPDEEPEEGQDEGGAHRAAEQPVRIFEPEDRLETLQRHGGIERPVFGEAPVVGEERPPRVLADGRQRPHQRAPVHHGEPGVVEARDAAEHDHRQHQAGEAQQPAGDGAPLPGDVTGRGIGAAEGPESRGVHAWLGAEPA